jgi:hypothetical protein
VQVTGGTGALTWSISAGTLPAGLNLNPINGVISGTPTAAGTSSFTVGVQDAGGLSDTQALSITINSNGPGNVGIPFVFREVRGEGRPLNLTWYESENT